MSKNDETPKSAKTSKSVDWVGRVDSSNLDAHISALTAAAAAVREYAHAPYSRFKVGAAVLDEQGRIHAGCNVENAAYPQGWCAEASALAVMVAAGGKQVLAVAVCAQAARPTEPVTPCGGCRQKLREFAGEHCPIWLADAGPTLPSTQPPPLLASHTLGSLLPHSFGPAHLGR
jgi:cytidine deaminase